VVQIGQFLSETSGVGHLLLIDDKEIAEEEVSIFAPTLSVAMGLRGEVGSRLVDFGHRHVLAKHPGCPIRSSHDLHSPCLSVHAHEQSVGASSIGGFTLRKYCFCEPSAASVSIFAVEAQLDALNSSTAETLDSFGRTARHNNELVPTFWATCQCYPGGYLPSRIAGSSSNSLCVELLVAAMLERIESDGIGKASASNVIAKVGVLYYRYITLPAVSTLLAPAFSTIPVPYSIP